MKMKEMDNFTISQSQIESGHWYQPYIHSVPYTFNRAQEAYYNGFSLDTAKNNLKKIAQKIFATLKTYYGSREKAFAKHLYGTEDLTRLAADIEDFITNFQAQYTSNRTNKYPLMDSLSTALDGLSSMKPSEADLMKAGKAKVIEALKKASVNPSKLGVNYVNQVTVVKSVIIDYLTIILKNIPNVQHPDQLAGDTFIALITGKPLSGLTKELKNTTKVLQQEVKYLKDFLEALRRGITPKLKDGKLRQGSIASSLSNNIGIFAESMVEEVIDDLIASGTTKIFQNVKIRVEQVGKKDVLKDITDTKIIFNNGIEDFEIGLDIKYN